ncbi:MAG: outer membrane beta-barrel domain-containing protein [Oligoflexia bacterium]|nr:outer membrane beta-barrel domain-containing protein [Oligoflexia bacterium]
MKKLFALKTSPFLWCLILLSTINFLYASEKDLYDFLWLDPDKKVYVLQNKVYKKKRKTYADIGYIIGINNAYQDTTGGKFNIGHYLTEEWAIEASHSSYSNKDNDNYSNLNRINGSVPFVRRPKTHTSINAVWSPFYGKINTFNKILYFDWSFALGVGQLEFESNKDTVSNPSEADNYTTEKTTSIVTKTNFKIHATKNIHIGVEYGRNSYRATGPTINNVPGTTSWKAQSEVVFSVGFSF